MAARYTDVNLHEVDITHEKVKESDLILQKSKIQSTGTVIWRCYFSLANYQSKAQIRTNTYILSVLAHLFYALYVVSFLNYTIVGNEVLVRSTRTRRDATRREKAFSNMSIILP